MLSWVEHDKSFIASGPGHISGTNGGVTFVGTLASIIGGLCIGFAYYVTVLLTCNEYYLAESPPQWLLIPVGGALGLLGSTLDSLLGATLQYSGTVQRLFGL